MCDKDNVMISAAVIIDDIGTRYRNVCDECYEKYNCKPKKIIQSHLTKVLNMILLIISRFLTGSFLNNRDKRKSVIGRGRIFRFVFFIFQSSINPKFFTSF